MSDATQGDPLSIIVALATVATPLLLIILSGFGWLIQQRLGAAQSLRESQLQRIRELEDKLRDDRLATYNTILEPFLLFFISEASFALDPKYKGKNKDALAVSKLMSVEYRQFGFKLSLVADDTVVRAYNQLMQFFYRSEADPRPIEEKTHHWLALMGDFLLSIRKSMGNESSALDRWEMIEWFMKDAPLVKMAYEKANASR